jgi:hypothetical protein
MTGNIDREPVRNVGEDRPEHLPTWTKTVTASLMRNWFMPRLP